MTRLFLHLVAAGKALIAGLMAAAWISLALADVGHFRATASLVAFLVVFAAVYAFTWWQEQGESGPTQVQALALGGAIVLAAGTLIFTLPPSESLLGGWDPGVYVHTAAAVARGGSLRIEDPDLASLDARERAVVARNLFGVAEPFGGMRVLPDGRTSPEFHHLYPCLMAVPFAFGGLRAALGLNPLLNAIAVVLVLLLARRMVGNGCGVLAALCFAFFPAQAWQAGFSTSEPLAQVLLLTGFLFLGPALEGRSWLDAILCGAAFGLALLARYNTVVLLVPMALALVVTWNRSLSVRHALAAAGIFALALIHLYLHQRYVAPYYAPLQGAVQVALLAAAALLAVWVALIAFSRRVARWIRSCNRKFRIVAATGFVVWVAFVWFVRPYLDAPGAISRTLSTFLPKAIWDVLGGDDAHNIEMLTSMFGRTGLALAFTGIVVWIMKVDEPWRVAWLYGSVAVLVLLLVAVFNDHFMMWVARRFVPVVVPLLAITAVVGLKAVCAKIAERSGVLALAVSVVLGVLVASGMAAPFLAVATTRDWPGLTAWFESVESLIPKDAWVYSDQPGFAAPLRYLYGKHAFQLQLKSNDRRERLADLMVAKLDQGHDVWLLTMDGPIQHPAFTCDPVAARPLNTRELNRQNFSVPEGVRPRGGNFLLYRLRPAGAAD